jgi:acyl dehydratase
MAVPEFPQLTEDVIERARQTISTEERPRPAAFSVLNEDVIRRWAYMLGDANPLWLDPEYAAATKWGSILSPPTFPETAVRGTLFDPLRAKRSTKKEAQQPAAPSAPAQRSQGGGLPGLATLQVGRQLWFYEPVHVGEEVRGTQRVVAIVDSEGRRDGDCIEPDCDVEAAMVAGMAECAWPKTRFVIQTFEHKVYSKRTGRLLMKTYRHEGRFPRGVPMTESKYRDIPDPLWDPAELQKIIDSHEDEYLRGADTLYVEDVRVGDEIPAIAKGPHTPNDYILYAGAFGGWFDVADTIKYQMLSRFPAAGVIDPRTNVPDFPNMMHLDSFSSSSMGYPRGFDASMQRISWFGHLVTNWMGDDATIDGLQVLHCSPLFLYEAMWLHGRVAEVDAATGAVKLTLWGENHRGDRISNGSATVTLPSRAAS